MRHNKEHPLLLDDNDSLKTLSPSWRAANPRKLGERVVREPRLVIKPERPSKSEEFSLN